MAGYEFSDVVRILMIRDGMTIDDAVNLLDDCRQQVIEGGNPEEILHEELGLEPDYMFALL